MDLQQLITETSTNLEEARSDLELLLMAIADKKAEVGNLEEELHGLRLAANRRQISETPVADGNVVPISAAVGAAESGTDLGALSRSDAVLYVLTASGRPLDRHAISTRLSTLGRYGDTADQISLALTNLKRSGRASRMGNGKWRADLSSAQG